ncbi:MAG TPA: molybdopterin-dependent oxidoreductase [Anaeromyxobacter sp.]
MVRHMNRRKFLRVTGGTVLGGLAAGALGGLAREAGARDGKSITPDRIVPSFCEICFWKCGVLAYVKDERVYKIEGNPRHPLSNGLLCPRGAGAVGALYDPDRLRQPLLRVNQRGEEKWKPVSWDEALDFTARRLGEVRDHFGAGSIVLFSHGHGGGFFKTLLKAIGSGNVVAPSYDQCRGPRMAGFGVTFGADPGAIETIDVANSKAVAFIGTHLGENMHNTAVQDMSAANARGAVFITVDPRFSIIASKSKYWLPIKPGTDTALLLAWANVLIGERLFQKDFVEKNTVGFDALAKHVEDKTPEWAYLQTGIEPGLIRDTARELARAAPAALVHPGRHVVWYGNDTQRARAVAIVNALLGNWAKKGGFYLPATLDVPEYKTAPFPAAAHFESRQKFPLASSALAYDACTATGGMPDESATVRAWIAYGCNVPLTLPNTANVIETMKKLELVVAIDTMPAEITGWADVILPENTYLERYDELHNPPYRTPYVALRQPAVASMYDTKPGWWIAKRLAEKMGVGQYFPWKDAEEYLASRVAAAGLDFAQLKRDGVIVREGASIYDDSPTLTFKTPSKKIELYSKALADAGLDPLPRYEPPEEPPAGYFRLLFGRAPTHTFSRTTNNPLLAEVFPENELWMNAEMARSLGLRAGDRVMLENQDQVKAGPIALRVTERIRQDCVYMVHGFGREDRRLRRSFGRGASDSRLVTRVRRDPAMGGTGMNVNFVTVYREA